MDLKPLPHLPKSRLRIKRRRFLGAPTAGSARRRLSQIPKTTRKKKGVLAKSKTILRNAHRICVDFSCEQNSPVKGGWWGTFGPRSVGGNPGNPQPPPACAPGRAPSISRSTSRSSPRSSPRGPSALAAPPAARPWSLCCATRAGAEQPGPGSGTSGFRARRGPGAAESPPGNAEVPRGDGKPSPPSAPGKIIPSAGGGSAGKGGEIWDEGPGERQRAHRRLRGSAENARLLLINGAKDKPGIPIYNFPGEVLPTARS